jgi:hypothetical protein
MDTTAADATVVLLQRLTYIHCFTRQILIRTACLSLVDLRINSRSFSRCSHNLKPLAQLVSGQGFQWFEVTLSEGQGTQRGAIAWADVRGATRVGDWNGCAAARFAPRGCRVLTLAGRLFGAEMQHPGVEKDVTVLWCKSAAERDVGALSSRLCKSCAHSAAAGLAGCHQPLLPAQINAQLKSLVSLKCAVCPVPASVLPLPSTGVVISMWQWQWHTLHAACD